MLIALDRRTELLLPVVTLRKLTNPAHRNGGPSIKMVESVCPEDMLLMTTFKIREDRLRRSLAKAGYHLTKTPARSWLRDHFGTGYMVVENDTNGVKLGCSSRPYEASLEDAEAFASKL